jgi:tetratricopeptide (TPR) repeat protein
MKPLAIVGLVLLVSVACLHLLTRPRISPAGPVTTSGVLAMRNLEGDLFDANARAAEDPTDQDACLRASGLLSLRARVTGDIDEASRAIDATTRCLAHHPSVNAYLLRAGQQQTLHRFAQARADVNGARALGADVQRVRGLERDLDWNAGLWGPAAQSIRADAAQRPSVWSIAQLARLEHDLGRFDAAEALYERALSVVDDTGPIAVSLLEVQRGMNLADARRFDEAERTFRSAIARMPMLVAAKDHLAETLHRLGRDGEATRLYEELVSGTSDPEFKGALASLYRARGRVAEADALRQSALRRWEELLAAYPEAMAWHASEFFAGEGGDPERARSLLRRNVELRPNPQSLEALARAERDAGAGARAEELLRRAAAIRRSVAPSG